jgi:broad-specificity NMP kinase
VIIEFTGVPGAGKSSIISQLSKAKLDTSLVVNIEKYVRSVSLLNIPTKLGYDIMLFLRFYKLTRLDFEVLFSAICHLDFKLSSLSTSLNICRNICKKLIIHRVIQAEDKVFLIDEGLSHIPMSLFVDVNKKVVKSDVVNLCKILPKVDRVILIDAKDDELLKRVLNRGIVGHRRMDFSTVSSVKLFMFKSREVVEILKEQINPEIYMNNTKTITLKNIIKLISN